MIGDGQCDHQADHAQAVRSEGGVAATSLYVDLHRVEIVFPAIV